MPQLTSTFLLRGGMNLVVPAINVPGGMAIAGVNYEPDVRGYRRIGGLERFDGHPKPSEASYWVLPFSSGDAAISEGDTIEGGTSGATGVVLIDAVVEDGSFGTSDASGYLVLTAVSGTFQSGEDLEVSSVKKAEASGSAVERGANSDANNSAWTRAATEAARADISAVPGSGPVRGIWTYQGEAYAFRDDAGATAGVMHKASSTGWDAQTFGAILKFDTGTAALNEGKTLTGGTSSATATIDRVVLLDGTWSGGDAEGYLILSDVTGTFQNNETMTDDGSPSGAAAADGTTSAIALPNGGRYAFTNHNFYGLESGLRMYFTNGVGKAHEWDGTILTPITTGVEESKDKPELVAEFQQHLFLTYDGGSLQHSGVGKPLSFSALDGAGEIGFGQDITNLIESASTALVVIGETRIQYLLGSDEETWQMQPWSDDSGAKRWTAQSLGGPIFMDNLGVRRMQASQAFGNFRMGTLTQLVQPIFDTKRRAGVEPVASVRYRSRDQYILFFDDGSGIVIYLGRKDPEVMPFEVPIAVTCACSGEDADGNEIILLGAEDGFVYQWDAGTSFDGEEVTAFIRLAFNSFGSPSQRKRFHKATLELDGSVETTIGLTAEASYGEPETPPFPEASFSVRGSGGFWNEFLWDQFYWSAPVVGKAEAYIDAVGTNLSLTILSDATYEAPHALSAVTFNYTYRSQVR